MKPFCFVLDSTAQNRTPKAILEGEWQCRRAGDSHVFQRRYLDSLDWRLLGKGLYLIADQIDGGHQLRLISARTNEPVAEAFADRLPVYLPDAGMRGGLNGLLTPILGRRALISQVQLAVTRHPLAVVDDEGATVARLDLEFNEPSADQAPHAHFERRLWFVPVPGRDKQNKAIVNLLSARGLPVSGAVIPVTEVISVLHMDTTRFEARPALKLSADERSDVGVKRLLGAFLAVMEVNRPAVIDDVDGDCLHDFRVAVRRSRSLLDQMGEVIPPRQGERAQQFFARLSHVTNRQRDLDVMLRNFDLYRSLLPARSRAQLDAAYACIVDQRHAAVAATAHLLNSAVYRRFVHGWRRYLEAAPPRRGAAEARRPLKAAADARIWKVYQRVLTQGAAIDAASPPEVLHDLRKRCKTLRYLIEFFASLYPGEKLQGVLKTLKRLQDNLGEYQDLHMHGILLAETRRRLADQGLLMPETDTAMAQVRAALEGRAARCRERFSKRFAVFGNADHRGQFKRLFKP